MFKIDYEYTTPFTSGWQKYDVKHETVEEATKEYILLAHCPHTRNLVLSFIEPSGV